MHANDVYPTAARIAVWTAAVPLLTQRGHLRQVCQAARCLLPPEVIDALLAGPHRLIGRADPQDATAARQPAGPSTTITGGTA